VTLALALLSVNVGLPKAVPWRSRTVRTGVWTHPVDPERRDYASFADFADPDGNTWVIQEIGYASMERDD
jgi:hypothetical protein